MRQRRFFVGVDIGGTFTDVILAEHGSHTLHTSKGLTTPGDPSLGVLTAITDACAQAGAPVEAIDRVVHATTLATNLILERKGARVGYVTTEGFGDLLLLMDDPQGGGSNQYNLNFEKSPPLVPRTLVVEARERMNARGEAVITLDAEQTEAAIERLARMKPDAVAVCLLHSYANPSHERKIAEILRRLLPGAYVALSSDVSPEFRETGRALTTVMSAYVGPVMARYVQRLETQIKILGIPGPLHIMQSNGGVMSASTAAAKAIYSVESGPAAGVIAAAYLGQRLGRQHSISFDMGGTTAKAGLIRDGKPNITHNFYVGGRASAQGVDAGFPINIPVIDLVEVGAGGGSIAWIDTGGSLQVGPRSAGAEPGPACYGFGGAQPTVTDADLLLGYLNPDYFLGGEMRIDVQASREAIVRTIASPLGMDPIAAASGIYEIANANMASAIRVLTVQRGIDPREFAVIGFGGAGPAHIVKVAEQFDIPTIIIPVSPGLASAMGLLVSDVTHDYVKTRIMEPEKENIAEINTIFRELEETGLSQMAREGVPADRTVIQRLVDARFKYQGHELSVPFNPGRIREQDVRAVHAAFRDLYSRLYGIRQASPVQLVNFRIRVIGAVPKLELARCEQGGGDPARALKGQRGVFFKDAGGFVATPVYDRAGLLPGDSLTGPSVIEESNSTTIVPPSYRASIEPFMSIVITRG